MTGVVQPHLPPSSQHQTEFILVLLNHFRDPFVTKNIEAICFSCRVCNTYCNSEAVQLVALFRDLHVLIFLLTSLECLLICLEAIAVNLVKMQIM